MAESGSLRTRRKWVCARARKRNAMVGHSLVPSVTCIANSTRQTHASTPSLTNFSSCDLSTVKRGVGSESVELANCYDESRIIDR